MLRIFKVQMWSTQMAFEAMIVEVAAVGDIRVKGGGGA